MLKEDYLVRTKFSNVMGSSRPKAMQPSGESKYQIHRFGSGMHIFHDSDSKHTYIY